MELRRIDRFLLKGLYLLTAGIVVMQVLGQNRWTSLMFTMTFPFTVLLWLRTIRKTITGTDLVMLFTIALAVVSVLVDMEANYGHLSFSYLKKVIMFSMTLLFFQTVYRLRIDGEMADFIQLVIDCLIWYLMLMYFSQRLRMFTLNGMITQYLTFRMSNPNLTGLYLACLYMLVLYRIFAQEKFIWKVLHIGMSLFLAVCILQTQSRNALLVIVTFTALCMWLVFRGRRNLHIGKIPAMLISTFPALFLTVYISVVYTPWIQKLFVFLVGEGKDLDSRIRIWVPALQRLGESPIVGTYYAISRGTGMSQMHNSHLDIAASYGIPVLVLVCLLLYGYLHQRGRRYADKQGYIYILGFACAIILGIGEAALFSGGLGLYVFAGAFLLLAGRREPAERA